MSVDVAAVVLVAAVVVVVSEKPAMLGGLADELLVLATYIKSVVVVQLVVHWFSGGKKPHPVDTAARHGASTRVTARNFFQKFSMMGCISASSRRNLPPHCKLNPSLVASQPTLEGVTPRCAADLFHEE